MADTKISNLVAAVAALNTDEYPVNASGVSLKVTAAQLRTLLINGQLAFPATQNASANANTLDDYEEGSWTPTIGGSGGQSGQVYSAQVGRYTKIGNTVTLWYRVALSTLGTITTDVEVQGLPFTVNGTVSAISPVQWVALTTTWVSIIGNALLATSVLKIRGATVGAVANSTALAQGDLSATTAFSGTVTYQV